MKRMKKNSFRAESMIFRAAQLYFVRGLRQEEVATALGVSRASVALYLQKARDAGLVEVRLRTEAFRHHELAIELERRFGIEKAFVFATVDESDEIFDDTLRLCVDVLAENIEDGDQLGVAWGRTLQRVSELLPSTPRRNLTVMQLCGNLGAAFGHSPEESASTIAKKFGATCRNLYAPLVVSNAALAEALMQEPIIANQFAAFKECNKTIFSIGDCKSDSHIVQCGAVSDSEMEILVANGARGVIAGRIISDNGQPMAYRGGADRVIGISLENLLKIPFRLAVVVGVEKVQAVIAGLRGKFATHIVLDSVLAEAVIAQSTDADGPIESRQEFNVIE